MPSKKGSQGIAEIPVAYELGLQCPRGREVDLLIGLLGGWWPDLANRPAAEAAFRRGLDDREIPESADPPGA
jgi:hypothetical protein